MPRWLQFALGLVTLVALAGAIIRALARHLPNGMESESYEALILVLAVSFVVIVVRAARGYRSEEQHEEGQSAWVARRGKGSSEAGAVLR